MILLIGRDKSSAYSLSIQFGISSGPHTLDRFTQLVTEKYAFPKTLEAQAFPLRCEVWSVVGAGNILQEAQEGPSRLHFQYPGP